MKRLLVYAAIVITIFLAVDSALYLVVFRGETDLAVQVALSDPRVAESLGRCVEPIAAGGKPVPRIVVLDLSCSPRQRIYIVEWLNPNSLWLTPLVRVWVDVGAGRVIELEIFSG